MSCPTPGTGDQSVSPRLRRTAQCNSLSFQGLFFVQSQADPACSSSMILSLTSPQHQSILSSTYPPPLATRCVCIVDQVSFQSRFVFSESHSMDCCSNMQYLAVHALPSSSSPNVSTHPSSVRSSDNFVFDAGLTISNPSNNSLHLALTP